MKTTSFLALALMFTGLVCRGQDDSGEDISGPGWVQALSWADPLTPASTEEKAANSVTFPAGKPIAEAVTPQIQALARGLGNDPVRIFNYVHDNIHHVFYFGSKKGAQLTLLEKSGNDFDQSALLVALLRAANYTNVGYQFAILKMPYDSADTNDLHHWLGLSLCNTNWPNTSNYFKWLPSSRGYPVWVSGWATNGILDTNTIGLPRVWVTLTLTNGGTTYVLDPAFKITQPVAGIDLAAATGLASGAFITSNALITAAGGTATGEFVKSLSESGLRNNLRSATTNLLGYIQKNTTNPTADQVLGGQQIVPSALTALPQSQPFEIYSTNTYPLETWTNQPTDFMSTISITVGGTSKTWFMPELQGQRLALTFSSNGLAQLWLEDSNVLQTANTGSGSTTPVILTVTHPFGWWNTSSYVPGSTAWSSTNNYQRTSASYAIIYAFEAHSDCLKWRQQQLDAYRQQGYSDTSTQVVTETLNVMGLSWLVQTELSQQMLAREWGQLEQNHHRFGRMSQEQGKGYYVDAFLQMSSMLPDSGFNLVDQQRWHQTGDVGSYLRSAMEHGIIEQLQSSNLTAASTVKMLAMAGTNTQGVYITSYTNWISVSNNLINYGSTLSNLDYLIKSGWTLLVPKDGSNHLAGPGTWAGYGYVQSFYSATPSNINHTTGMIIGRGSYNGGYVSLPVEVNPSWTADTSSLQSGYNTVAPPLTYVPTIADPVEAADGTFQVSTVDLALGGTEPRGLSLSRYYNSALRRQNPAAMSCGWVHNYYCTAKPVSSPLSGLGAATVQQMAPMIVASWAALNFYTPQGDARNWTITALIAKWGADQLLTNSVSVTLGKDMLQFTRQPDGLFTPPAGSTMTLTNTGNSYSLKERRGRTFKFNSAGFLTNIADPYAAQMTFTYDSSNRVQTVKDSVNRSLTFVYTNTYTNGALVQVADSANRSVSYRYTTNSAGQLDLAAVIDPEGQPTTFLYDATNHQITAVLDALSQTVSSNIYDGFGRVTTQYSQGDTTKAWTLGWSDSARFEQDPTGSLRWFLFDEKSRLVAVQDALGNVSQTVYDGQDHVIMTISPSNATSRFIYDANQNLVCTVDPLGHSNQFFYDSTNNLIRSVDARGNTNTFGYNTNFSLVAMTSGAGDWVTYNYNTNGTLHSRTDAGSTNTYDYDSYCQVSRITYSGTLGSELFLNSPLGDVLTHTNARSLPPTSFTYNKRRQLTATIGPTNVTTGIAYDAVGNVQFTTNSRGYVTTNTWSSTRKLLSTGFPATPQGSPITTNGYDSRDWLQLTVSNPSKPIAATVNYTYDPAGRIALLSDPLQRQTHFGYDQDGRQTGVTNDAGEKVTQQWDARGLLTQVTDNASHNVQRGYDEAGNQTSLTNRNAKTWQFQFDGADRLITTKSAKTTNSLAYNSRGLVQYLTNSMRQTTTLGYDGKGRLTSRTDPVGTINYGHDANDNLTGATNAGQSVGLYWTFDAYDRVASYKDLDGNVIQYGYDAAGNLTTLVYPGNRSVSYTYDSLNRLTTVTDWATRQTTFTYDLANRLTSITRPNGKVRLINYDAAGQTTNIIEKLANNYPIAFFQLNWTNAGRVQSEFAAPLPHTNAPPPPYRGMAIGDDNRITTVTNGNSTLSVTYDANGNLTNGPITNLAQATYSYNARNQLLSAGGLQYGYDPAGNRTSLTNGANVTRFVVNPNAPLPQVLMRITSTGTNYYIYGLGLLYEVTVNNAGVETATNTYHFDYRGSTVAITDAGGNVRDRMEYSAYGMLTYRAGTNDTPFLFNGRYGVQTDLNGLYYMRARYYNPYLCRFLNPDPAGFEGGMNFYAFANGNPVSYFDPSGLGAVGGNAAFSWINNASGGSTSSSDPFGLGGNSDNSPLLNPNANQSGQPCIMCHGVSAAGFNGNINAFSGLATISGVTPQAAATMQKWANSLQENGPQLLADIGTGAVFFAGGLASVRSAAPAVADTTLASTVNLAEGEASLVLTRNGQLIAQQPVGSMLTHADFAAQNGAVTASGSLAPGYWVGTVGKVNGSIIGMNSMTFYGNQMPNANATAALRATFR